VKPIEVRRPAQDRPSPNNQAATTLPDKDSLVDFASAYCVVVVAYGHPRRRIFLSLHSATQAVQRARKRGQPAELIFCKLEPVTASLADLELDGEVTE